MCDKRYCIEYIEYCIEFLINQQTCNNGHRKMQKRQLDSELKKIQHNIENEKVITNEGSERSSY